MVRTNGVKWAVYLGLIVVTTMTGCKKQTPGTLTDIDRLQGTWVGRELGSNSSDPWKLVITGDKVQADGPGPEDYSGTITFDETTMPKSALLTIDKCAFESYVGAVSNNIYKLEDDKLTLAGAEPGSGSKPTTFQPGSGTRVFEFSKQQAQ